MWGSEDSKTDGWTSTRAYKQVAKAKLDLNKTQVFSTAAKEYMKGEVDHKGAGVVLQP
jgi:hypothetical protein